MAYIKSWDQKGWLEMQQKVSLAIEVVMGMNMDHEAVSVLRKS